MKSSEGKQQSTVFIKSDQTEGKHNFSYDSLLEKFNCIYEKQEILVRVESQTIIHEYGYSETHCIDLIGRMDMPNVTKIAAELHMTRGAISKIVKRLQTKDMITSYMLDDNRKEIYYELTDQGWEIYKAHKIRHEIWEERDRKFFREVDLEVLNTVSEFLDKYDEYLEMRIEDIKDCNY
ncbi:MarR family winged helix-turn-helix transcriptional regulator [Muricomes intestini]|jgi:DNA-binding MarR family transcriptional regulator|uniref:MarR family winged helix-turn-helix transcriptional regulator n=1 Tax=Muricomes intestini TaxID=1796634 RepID=UPI002FE126DA